MKQRYRTLLYLLGFLTAGGLAGWYGLTGSLPAGASWLSFLAYVSFLTLALGWWIEWRYQRRIGRVRQQLTRTLQVLEQFDIDDPSPVQFENSPIRAFNELHEYLLWLFLRIQQHYLANKQFTENAAHELQTPLAIIKGHAELLLQSPGLGEDEIGALDAILKNTNRVARLNTALILLSKIEHDRFQDFETVRFRTSIEEVLENFEDLIEIQQLRVHVDFPGDPQLELSCTLAEILIANLVQNAIRHNYKGGEIDIVLTERALVISNTGKVLHTPPEELFQRFRRETEASESLGLGLSIIRRITDKYGWQISYLHDAGRHTLRLEFFPELNPETP